MKLEISAESDIQNKWQIKCQQIDIGKTNVCKFFSKGLKPSVIFVTIVQFSNF